MFKGCPGKVLICGGHLILDPVHKGISFPFPAACIFSKARKSYVAHTATEIHIPYTPSCLLKLSFCQRNEGSKSNVDFSTFSLLAIFKDVQFSPPDTITLHAYLLRIESNCISAREGWAVIPLCHLKGSSFATQICLNDDPVPFEQFSFQATTIMIWYLANYKSLQLCNGEAYNQKLMLIEMETISDQAFYTTPPCKFADQNGAPIWNTPIKKLCKSGLGSSAAYVSSLVLALCEDDCTRTMLLTQALLAHWIGQGCKGSGFDICTSLLNALETRPVCLIFSQSREVSQLLPIVASSIRLLFKSIGKLSLVESQLLALVEVFPICSPIGC